MKIKILIGVLVFLIVLNLATIGSFLFMRWRADDDAPRVPRAPRVTRINRNHELPHTPAPPFRPSGEERKQLFALLEGFRADTEELRLEMFALEENVFELMRRDEVPRARVDSLLQEIAGVRTEIGRLAIDKLIESKEYLSPEQQQRFFESILETRSGRGGGRRGHQERRSGEAPGRGGHKQDKGDRI
jgi:hypothetical protein